MGTLRETEDQPGATVDHAVKSRLDCGDGIHRTTLGADQTTGRTVGYREATPADRILIERGVIYGKPNPGHPGAFDNLRCADELIRVYQQYSAREPGTGHDYCILMVLAKIARIATGQYHQDNYADGRNYLELARVAGAQE
jgi:hypothetical protein